MLVDSIFSTALWSCFFSKWIYPGFFSCCWNLPCFCWLVNTYCEKLLHPKTWINLRATLMHLKIHYHNKAYKHSKIPTSFFYLKQLYHFDYWRMEYYTLWNIDSIVLKCSSRYWIIYPSNFGFLTNWRIIPIVQKLVGHLVILVMTGLVTHFLASYSLMWWFVSSFHNDIIMEWMTIPHTVFWTWHISFLPNT